MYSPKIQHSNHQKKDYPRNNKAEKTSSRIVFGTALVFLATFSVVSVYGQNDSIVNRSQVNEQQVHIKGFSESEVMGLQAGEWMGMAKAAELNNYPGPRHVLDLAEELALTSKQVAGSKALFQRMKRNATRLGVRIIQREKELEARIANGDITPNTLRKSLKTIADLRGKLRYTHMVAHLKQRKLLTEKQVKQYNQLRGHTES